MDGQVRQRMADPGDLSYVHPALRPSEYTAALIQAVRARADWVANAEVLEIGSGSGVVLAALAGLGARSLSGVDIEEKAVESGERLLRGLGHGAKAEIRRGYMWGPASGRRFELIVANLPHFPMPPAEVAGRLPSWSAGGSDGRRLLTPFLEGLDRHLVPGGRAVITHNAFVDLDQSQKILDRAGLSLRIASTSLVYIPVEKLERMTPGILCAERDRSIHRYGPYAFGDVHILEIGSPGALA